MPRYYCHTCQRDVPVTISTTGDLSCNVCKNEFVEEREDEAPVGAGAGAASAGAGAPRTAGGTPAAGAGMPGMFPFLFGGGPGGSGPQIRFQTFTSDGRSFTSTSGGSGGGGSAGAVPFDDPFAAL